MLVYKLQCGFLWNLLERSIHVKSPSLGGRLPLFDPISLLNIHLPPKRGNLPLFGLLHLPMIFSLTRRNFVEFFNENALISQQGVLQVQKYNDFASYEEISAFQRREYLIIFKISAAIWTLMDEINVAEWFLAKSPSFPRCKEGDLPLLNFSNLTCMEVFFKFLLSG